MRNALLTTALLMSIVDRGTDYYDRDDTVTHKNKSKECIKCGIGHCHNNSFCSPKCCRDFKQDKRLRA